MADGNWTCAFSPDLPRRSYMMDVDPSDAVAVPDIRGAVGSLEGVEPLPLVQAHDWEPVPAGDKTVQVGTVVQSLLMISGEIDPVGRTPCHEEHVIVVAVCGEADRDAVVVCPIVTWADFSRYRRDLQTEEALQGARRGEHRSLLPILLPRAGYDTEPNAFIWIALREATLRKYIAYKIGTPEAPIRLRRELIPGLQAAVTRLQAPADGHDSSCGGREPG